jgi:hypothetical protein
MGVEHYPTAAMTLASRLWQRESEKARSERRLSCPALDENRILS